MRQQCVATRFTETKNAQSQREKQMRAGGKNANAEGEALQSRDRAKRSCLLRLREGLYVHGFPGLRDPCGTDSISGPVPSSPYLPSYEKSYRQKERFRCHKNESI